MSGGWTMPELRPVAAAVAQNRGAWLRARTAQPTGGGVDTRGMIDRGAVADRADGKVARVPRRGGSMLGAAVRAGAAQGAGSGPAARRSGRGGFAIRGSGAGRF